MTSIEKGFKMLNVKFLNLKFLFQSLNERLKSKMLSYCQKNQSEYIYEVDYVNFLIKKYKRVRLETEKWGSFTIIKGGVNTQVGAKLVSGNITHLYFESYVEAQRYLIGHVSNQIKNELEYVDRLSSKAYFLSLKSSEEMRVER